MSKLTVILLAVFLILSVCRVGNPEKDASSNYGNSTWSLRIASLASEICGDAKTDKEKSERLYKWIVAEIEYDEGYGILYQSFDADRTVNTRKGLCFDMANLYAVFCRSQGIRCVILEGYKHGNPAAKHAWNRVYYDGSWWNLDPSFDAVRFAANMSLYGFHNVGSECSAEDKEYIITRIY